MARKTVSKERDVNRLTYDVQAVVLSRFDVLQYIGNQGEEKERLILDCLISPVEEAENVDEAESPVYYSSACFRCSRDGGESLTSVRMAAMYSFAFRCSAGDHEQVELASKLAASTSVWSHFMSMFGLANSQMRARMPLLPIDPGALETRPMEELVEVFNVFGRDDDISSADH